MLIAQLSVIFYHKYCRFTRIIDVLDSVIEKARKNVAKSV